MNELLLAALQFEPRADDVEGNLARVEAGLREAAARGVSFVGLPEMWPTSFVDVGGRAEELAERSGRAVAAVTRLSGVLGLTVCGSAFGPAPVAERLHNRLHVLDRGRCIALYDKVHLFSPTAEPRHFVAGEEAPRAVRTSAGLVAGAVCYDLRFPELLRTAHADGAQLLCVPAQWPVTRAAHWRALAVARAIENQCFVVAVNRTGSVRLGRRGRELEFPGNSLVVSPHGVVLAEGRGEEGLVVGRADLDEARHYRVRVPVAKDARPDLYARWLASGPSTPERSGME